MKKKALIIGIIGVFLLIQPLSAQTWEMTKRLTWTSGHSTSPALAVDSNNHIHVVWMGDTSGVPEIYYRKSTNGGTTWTIKRLSWNSRWTNPPAIAVGSNNNIHVVWFGTTPGNYEIYYKRSTDGGANWTTKRLTYNSGYSYFPDIAVNLNNHIYVVWEDDTPGNDDELFCKRSTNEGITWTTKRMTWNSKNSNNPSIAIDLNNQIHLVWEDGSPGNDEVFYTQSTDGGENWIKQRLTWNSGTSEDPKIAVYTGWEQIGGIWQQVIKIHTVWYDDTPGNFEIFYKRGIL